MKKVVLDIDTSDRTKSVVSLTVGNKTEKLVVETPLGSGTAVLSSIETILGKHGLKLTDITDFRVATGPGSYTGLRVGAAIVNTFGWLLRVPVNGNAARTPVVPEY